MSERQIADAGEREHALDPAQSFIVQAPAGSGKTGLLIQRYLRLMTTVSAPEEVLAITFTRKAAGEMRARVLEALQRARSGTVAQQDHDRKTLELAGAVLRHADAQGWELLENASRLRIQTIDALCASLTRQMPVLSHFGAPPSVSEDARELYRLAARETLTLRRQAPWPPAVERLLRHLDNNLALVEGLLADMLARRDQWLRHVARAGATADARPILEQALARVVSDALAGLRRHIADANATEILALARYAAANLREAGADSEILDCLDLALLPAGDAGDLPAWRGLAALLLKADGEWRKSFNKDIGFPAPSTARHAEGKARCQAMKARAEALIADLSTTPGLHEHLRGVRALPPVRYSMDQWEVMRSLIELLPTAVAHLKVVFSGRGQVDFTEVAQASVRALGTSDEPTDLALSLDYRLRHILVDEFQDTSLSQYDLLAGLTAGWQPGDGRTLFLVGDPMQSIYRFREAEVGLFLRARHTGIGQVALTPLTLRVNFRSRRPIVEWVNETFVRVLPREEDLTTGAVPYTPSVAFHDAHSADGVFVHPVLDEAPTAEASRVVALVQAARTRDPQGTIAILVQARTHLTHVLPALKAAGLAYRAIDIEQLGQRPLVQDLLALTRALLHPADRVAWLAVLRAPWCGLTLADLVVLAGDPRRVICEAMTDDSLQAALSDDARRRLGRVAPVLLEARQRRRRLPLRRWVEAAWLRLGGPACTDKPGDLEDARVFFELLEELDEAGDLPELPRLIERVEQLFALPDADASDSLQVMTVHKAKGLEFDTVIITGLARAQRGDDKRLLMWMERPRTDGQSDLLLAPVAPIGADQDPIYAYIGAIDRRKGGHETGRLLYVAATRARSQLHLLAQAVVDEVDGRRCVKAPRKGCLLQQLWPVVEPVFVQAAARREAGTVQAIAAGTSGPPAMRRLAVDWQLPPPPAGVSGAVVAPAPAREDSREAVEFRWATDTARHVGTVVHRMLRQIAEQGVTHWDAARVRARRGIYRAVLAQLGVPEAGLKPAVERVETALMQVLADSRGRWLLDNTHAESRCEFALTGIIKDKPVNIIVDRTFIANGVRWIVDYKVGAHEGTEVDAFLDNERLRYAPQLERYRSLFTEMESRPIRLGLYFPLLQGWREWG